MKATKRRPSATGEPAHRAIEPINGSVLVVDDEPLMRRVIGRHLTAAGCAVTFASNGEEALARLREAHPDVVVSDVNMPGIDGFELLKRVRSEPSTEAVPVILITARGDTEDIVAGLGLGADDYLVKPFAQRELLARVRVKIERPPVPAANLTRDRPTGLMSNTAFIEELEREVARARKTKRTGVLAYIEMHELARLRTRFSSTVLDQIELQVVALITEGAGALDLLGHDEHDRFMHLMPETSGADSRRRLVDIMDRVARHEFFAADERFHITPVVGYVEFGADSDPKKVAEQCSIATQNAERQLDLLPLAYNPKMQPIKRPRAPGATGLMRVLASLPVQILITQVLAFAIPLGIYLLLNAVGIDITPVVYVVVVIALLITATLIWVEGFLALRRVHPPHLAEDEYVPATAIIAAYLPNEAATIVETIKAFQRIDYAAGLQIILAYNTPRPLPVENTLREMARADHRFRAIAVEGSESKAQNVNAALSEATGEFIGIFDADHHPDPHCFRRAWRWLASGYDAVQGHCMVRNGHQTWISRLVAVEFEAIYSVSHPGRTRLHDFGIFGGSNGYWKAEVLRETRMHATMLTEDIDSSIRALLDGRRVGSDPLIVSRELAPVTLLALWHQRNRWAQGWFQVSYHYILRGLRSHKLSLRQKLGLFHLLAWRETYPWITNQIIPIIVFWSIKYGFHHIYWFVPLFVMTTLFTLGTGPAQVIFVWRLAHRDIRRHRSWLVGYLLESTVFYTSLKNLISVVAQLNEAMQQRKWMITPRSARAAATAAERHG